MLLDAPTFTCHDGFSVTTSISPRVRPEISPVTLNPLPSETLLKKLKNSIGVFSFLYHFWFP